MEILTKYKKQFFFHPIFKEGLNCQKTIQKAIGNNSQQQGKLKII